MVTVIASMRELVLLKNSKTITFAFDLFAKLIILPTFVI